MAADHPKRTLGVPRAYAWPLGVLALCLGLTLLNWRAERRNTAREARLYFEFRVRDAQQRIEQRLKTYQQVLRDVQGRVTTAPVDRQGFRKFVAAMNLGANYPGIQGLGLALHVPGGDRARHLAGVRRDGLPGYDLRPAGDREAYAPVIYLEPASPRNQRALGFDLRSEPVRRAALDLARDLDDLTLTGKLRLVQEPAEGGQAGFIMFLPVYHLGPGEAAPYGDLAQRRAALRGWVNAPFRMADLMAGVFGERAHELDIQIYDGADPAPAALMFDGGAPPAANPEAELRAQVLIETGHRQWLLKARALPALGPRQGADRASLVLRSGLLASALLTLLTWALALSRRRAVLLLRQAQLEELNRSLEDRVAQAVAQVRQKDQMLITQGRQAAMGEMIGNIAHQWRQPLNALSMLLMNLRDAHRCQELDDRALEEALAKGNLLIQKMSSTISDFTGFFKPDKAATAFSALGQVRGAVALVDASFQAGNIAIRVEAAEDLLLMGFPNEFSQVLLNLLANAKEAITKARPPMGLVTIRLARAGAMGSVCVQDNGGGVPEAILDKVFEPYFSTREAGTGLGLYMCKQIVERNMQGRITVQNAQDGAQFSILLALAGAVP